jgi:hypothetical protein
MLRMQDFALNISKFAWGGMPPNPPRKLCSLCRSHPENLFFPISLSLGKNNCSWPDHAVRAASKFNRKKRRKRPNWYLFTHIHDRSLGLMYIWQIWVGKCFCIYISISTLISCIAVYCYYLFAFVLFAYYCSSAVLSQTFCEQGIRHSAVLGMTRTTSVV